MKATDRERKKLKDFVHRFSFKTTREVKNECPGWDSKSVHTSSTPCRSFFFCPTLLPRNPY
jgi:hypothetical protein